MTERTKEIITDIALGIWVMIIPLVELNYLMVPTRSWGVAFLYIPLCLLLILIHYGLAWLALWIYEKITDK